MNAVRILNAENICNANETRTIYIRDAKLGILTNAMKIADLNETAFEQTQGTP